MMSLVVFLEREPAPRREGIAAIGIRKRHIVFDGLKRSGSCRLGKPKTGSAP